MAKYINEDELLEDIEHNVVFTLRPDKPSSINAELRGANKIIDRIRCAPAADVAEVRHGRWISVEADVRFRCSLCDCEVSTSWDYEQDGMFDYCPCCGAKMDGGADND